MPPGPPGRPAGPRGRRPERKRSGTAAGPGLGLEKSVGTVTPQFPIVQNLLFYRMFDMNP